MQVLGHLGFGFEDVQAASVEETGRSCAAAKDVSSRVTSKYMVWVGCAAMSFEVMCNQKSLGDMAPRP